MRRRRLRAGPHSFRADVINDLGSIVENPEAAAYRELAPPEHIPRKAGPRADGDGRSVTITASILGDARKRRTGGGKTGRTKSALQAARTVRRGLRVEGS